MPTITATAPTITPMQAVQTPYQTALSTGMTETEAQQYLPYPQNLAVCRSYRYYSHDPAGNLLIEPFIIPGTVVVAGVVALLYGWHVVGALALALGLNELPVWGCSAVPSGNSCPEYQECNTFICRNGGCGF